MKRREFLKIFAAVPIVATFPTLAKSNDIFSNDFSESGTLVTDYTMRVGDVFTIGEDPQKYIVRTLTHPYGIGSLQPFRDK